MDAETEQSVEGIGAAAARLAEELQRARDNIGRAAGSASDDLAAQLRQLQDDLAAIQSTVGGFGRAASAEAAEAASRIGAAGADAARQFAYGARQQANSALGDFEDFARKNPTAVLGGAVGLGVILGLLLRRH
jgi:ElaB/YqjD/DUF883 family membrane-anchored ribosome-binding protein